MYKDCRIDIVLAHFNGSRFIREQLTSIFESELPSEVTINILVIDDCSIDSEYRNLLNVTANFPNIKVIRNLQNVGVVKSFEKGLSLTEAPYVMLCDQDDVWMKTKVIKSFRKIESLDENKPGLVFTDLRIVDTNLNILHHSMSERHRFNSNLISNYLLLQNVVTGCTIIMNRKLIKLALPFPNEVVVHDHWLALCAFFGGRVAYISDQTILYRQHGKNLIGAGKISFLGILWHFKKFSKAYILDIIKTKLQISVLANRLLEKDLADSGNFIHKVRSALEKPGLIELVWLKKTKVIKFNVKSLIMILICFLKPNSNKA